MALDHNAVVTELWRRINEALTIPLQTAATAASDALLAQIAAEAARDEVRGVRQYVDTELDKKADKAHKHGTSDLTDYPGHTVVLGSFSHGKIPVRESDSDALRVGETPKEDYHAASKKYVDGEVGKKADTSHTHVTADITDSTDWLSPNNPNKIVRTRDDGYIHGNDPTSMRHVATKNYVDSEVGKKADTGHKHASFEVTDKTHYGGSGNAGKVANWGSDGHLYDPNNPTTSDQLSRKGYVDQEVAKKADKSHAHKVADITDLPKISTLHGYALSIVQRTSSGNIDVPATPGGNRDAASKSYVDQEVAQKADVSHKHSIADVTAKDGTTTAYDLPPNPSTTDDLDIAVRTTSGRLKTPTPSSNTDAANKGYVDNNVPWIGSQSAYNSVTKSSGRLYVIT